MYGSVVSMMVMSSRILCGWSGGLKRAVSVGWSCWGVKL